MKRNRSYTGLKNTAGKAGSHRNVDLAKQFFVKLSVTKF